MAQYLGLPQRNQSMEETEQKEKIHGLDDDSVIIKLGFSIDLC
jgi:hypothetical protein